MTPRDPACNCTNRTASIDAHLFRTHCPVHSGSGLGQVVTPKGVADGDESLVRDPAEKANVPNQGVAACNCGCPKSEHDWFGCLMCRDCKRRHGSAIGMPEAKS